jgi:hypothetical protein
MDDFGPPRYLHWPRLVLTSRLGRSARESCAFRQSAAGFRCTRSALDAREEDTWPDDPAVAAEMGATPNITKRAAANDAPAETFVLIIITPNIDRNADISFRIEDCSIVIINIRARCDDSACMHRPSMHRRADRARRPDWTGAVAELCLTAGI